MKAGQLMVSVIYIKCKRRNHTSFPHSASDGNYSFMTSELHHCPSGCFKIDHLINTQQLWNKPCLTSELQFFSPTFRKYLLIFTNPFQVLCKTLCVTQTEEQSGNYIFSFSLKLRHFFSLIVMHLDVFKCFKHGLWSKVS